LRVPPVPEFQTETFLEAGFDPPTVPVKEMVPGFRPIAGAVRVRLTGIVRVLEAPSPEIVIVSL